MATRLFGTDGIRGIANTELTPEIAFKLGQAASKYLGDRIVVGKDTRRSGDMLEAAVVAGLTSGGADVLLAGVVPTPAVALLVRDLDADGGVVISASHNPPEYNGLKLFNRDGFKLADEIEDEIEEMLISRDDTKSRVVGGSVGTVSEIEDAAERYIAHAVASVGDVRLDGMVVAIDCGHGASAETTPEAFRRLGATVTSGNCEYNGMDINVDSGSTHLDACKELVAQSGAALGVAHDGDADRVLLIDETGAEVDGDFIEAICGVDLKERNLLPDNTIVSTIMANMGLEAAMQEHGVRVVKTGVGDRYVLEAMRAGGYTLGGEQSGHIIFLDYNSTGDGLITALQVAAIMVRKEATLSQLKTVMTRYPQVLENVPATRKGQLEASSVLADAIDHAEAELGDSGRVLVRASGTEPLVRVMAEAKEEEIALKVVDILAAVVAQELN